VLRLLRVVVIAAGGSRGGHAADPTAPVVTLRAPEPLLAVLDRDDLYDGAPARRDRVRAQVRRRFSALVEAAFGSARGARRDVVGVEPGVRRRLLELAHLEDRTAPPPTAVQDRRLEELRARRHAREREIAGDTSAAAWHPPFAAVLATSAGRLRDGWYHFVPAIVVMYAMAELVPRGVPTGSRSLVAGLLLLLNLVWYAAAASTCAGRWRQGLLMLVLSRASVAMSYLLVFVVWGALTLLGLFLVALAGGIDASQREPIAAALAVFLAVPLATRLWPVLAVPFLYPGYSRWSVAAGAAVWVGPGIGTAWRMTGRAGVFSELTLPLLLTLGPAAFALHAAPATPFLHVLYYAVFLPVAATIVDVAAERIRVATPYDRRRED
jgi:hypothetical protein